MTGIVAPGCLRIGLGAPAIGLDSVADVPTGLRLPNTVMPPNLIPLNPVSRDRGREALQCRPGGAWGSATEVGAHLIDSFVWA
ncbi:hypothetical protein ACIA5G_39325 [Amycolatopsis sp. NPDC051758]|uniref:hypothetical protein n=1 Tax=Amycolatopsis sp. NPDC051758 TaxID=3363935 RepID=UPI00378F426A